MTEPILIWGSGAIGGTIGAHLRLAGREILFVDVVPEHVQAIASEGLRIDGPVRQFTVKAPAVTPEQMSGTHKLILLAVKAQHTEAAVHALKPFLAEDGAVVSCQNGLNEPVIAGIVGAERTIGAFVNFGSDYQGPGQITYGLPGAVVVGELEGRTTPRITELQKTMQLFEPEAVLTDNIFGYLWGKMSYGAVLKYTSLTHDTIADFLADPRRRPGIVALAREMLTVANAQGVTPLGFNGFDPVAFFNADEAAIDRSLAVLVEYNCGSGKPHTGIWRDLVVRKRPTESPAQGAPIQAAARRHGIAIPHFDRLLELIRAVEEGRREIGPELADELTEGLRAPA